MSDKKNLAIAIMGKALSENGQISCEYAAKIAKLANIWPESNDKYALLIFLGGKTKAGASTSEAKAGQEALARVYPGLNESLRESGVEIILEETSRNSIENVHHLAKILHKRAFHQVDLISSDHHLERLEVVDRFMKNQSLLQLLGNLRGELIKAPYYFAGYENRVISTQAEIYKLADQLNVPRVNVEGVLQATEQGIYPGVTDCFAKTIIALHKIASDHQKWPAELAELRPILLSSLSVLNGCLSSLLSFQTSALVATSDAIAALRTLKNLLDHVIDDLRRMTDQDRPVQTSDWDRLS